MSTLDSETSIEYLRQLVLEFNKERDWTRFQKPRDLAISICLESAELLELFQWKSGNNAEKLRNSSEFELLKEELADIIIYCLSLSATMKIEISDIVQEKIKKNAIKYPK